MYSVMVLKTLNRMKLNLISLIDQKGITIVELIVTFTIGILIFSGAVVIFKPWEMFERGRDNKRLSDVSTLERMISEYKIDTEDYPGAENVTYYSNSLPSGSVGPLFDSVNGWIGPGFNFSNYSVKLPIDPTNTGSLRYTYLRSGETFEINAVLEYNTELMVSDGGDDNSFYEVGNDLTLL